MANGDILSDFGINLLEEEIDDVIFQTNEFLTDATFTGAQGPFWWILQMCMALAALFSIVMAAGIAYKMMVKQEPLDVMKLFRPLAVSIIICWWYPPADTGMAGSRNNWCFLDFLSYIPNCIGSYTHDLYEAEASQIADRFEEVQQLIHVRDTMYTNLQAQADVAHTGTSDPNLIEATMEQTGVDEVTSMEKDAAKLWFASLTAGVIVGIDKIIMLIALVVFRIGWWDTIKVVRRAGYKIDDPQMWFDYIKMLDRIGRDLHSPTLVAPKDLKAVHDEYVAKAERQRIKEQREKDRKRAEEDEAKFEELKGRYTGLVMTDGEIVVHTLNSIAEYYDEGSRQHICVGSSSYYLKENTLVFTAKIKDKTIATIEISLKDYSIIQCRAFANKVCQYQDRIAKIISDNIKMIAERKRA